jgi:hypothetical protein
MRRVKNLIHTTLKGGKSVRTLRELDDKQFFEQVLKETKVENPRAESESSGEEEEGEKREEEQEQRN